MSDSAGVSDWKIGTLRTLGLLAIRLLRTAGFASRGLAVDFGIALLVSISLPLLVRWRSSRGRGPALALRRFELREPMGVEPFLNISGRATGIVAWLLVRVGLDPVATLEATPEGVIETTTGPGGTRHRFAPLSKVDTTDCRYWLPLSYLFWAAGFFLYAVLLAGGVGSGYLGLLVGAGIFLVMFFIDRSLELTVTAGGTTLGLRFRPSVIEQVSIDLAKARQSVELINSQVLRWQPPVPEARTEETPEVPETPQPPSSPRSGEPAAFVCLSCGAPNPPENGYCDACGVELRDQPPW